MSVAPSAINEGAFVISNSPFGLPSRTDIPGPAPRIAYCLGVQTNLRGPALILAYTSSGPWRPPGLPLPLGAIEFDLTAARILKQKPFHRDLRVLARDPPLPAWLPSLNQPNCGVVARADKPLRDRINAIAEQLASRRPEVIQIRGIASMPPKP